MVVLQQILPRLNLPTTSDFGAEGVALSGSGQPNAMVEIWAGESRVGTAQVGPDGRWSLQARLSEGSHQMIVRTVDAAGKTLNEASAGAIKVAKAPAAAGQAYIVKAGDWLSALAQKFYGDATLYPRIVEGTNAKAASDSTFAKISDPDLIEAGQKLWIPPKPAD